MADLTCDCSGAERGTRGTRAERDRYRQALGTIRPVIRGVRVGALGLAALDDVDERIELALNPARRKDSRP